MYIVLEPFVHAIYTVITLSPLVRGDAVVWNCEFLVGGVVVLMARRIIGPTSTKTF
jgi:hypothetical protein